jgi:hypothetical protein
MTQPPAPSYVLTVLVLTHGSPTLESSASTGRLSWQGGGRNNYRAQTYWTVGKADFEKSIIGMKI